MQNKIIIGKPSVKNDGNNSIYTVKISVNGERKEIKTSQNMYNCSHKYYCNTIIVNWNYHVKTKYRYKEKNSC